MTENLKTLLSKCTQGPFELKGPFKAKFSEHPVWELTRSTGMCRVAAFRSIEGNENGEADMAFIQAAINDLPGILEERKSLLNIMAQAIELGAMNDKLSNAYQELADLYDPLKKENDALRKSIDNALERGRDGWFSMSDPPDEDNGEAGFWLEMDNYRELRDLVGRGDK